jgi:hypothetical protein
MISPFFIVFILLVFIVYIFSNKKMLTGLSI